MVSCSTNDKVEDLKTLEGIWIYPVDDQLNILFFHEKKVNLFTFDGFQEYNYTINTDKSPHQIDLISILDSNYSMKGIYEIEGRKLKIKLNTQLSLKAKRPQSLAGMNVGFFEKSDWNNKKFNDFYAEKTNPKLVKISDLTKELLTDSLNMRKLLKRSFLYVETNQHSKASADLEKVRTLNKYTYPKWQIWDYLASSYARENKDSISHLYLDSLISEFPQRGESYHQKGLLFCKNGKIELGCMLFNLAIHNGAFETDIRVSQSEFCK